MPLPPAIRLLGRKSRAKNGRHQSSGENPGGGFGQKLGLLVIDKILIGVAAALIVLYFQSENKKIEEVRVQKISVSRVYTEFLEGQRKEIVAIVADYFSLVDEIKPFGRATDEKQRRLLLRLHSRLQLALFSAASIGSSIKASADPLLEEIASLNKELLGNGIASAEIDAHLENLRSRFQKALAAYRKASVKALVQDLADIENQDLADKKE